MNICLLYLPLNDETKKNCGTCINWQIDKCSKEESLKNLWRYKKNGKYN